MTRTLAQRMGFGVTILGVALGTLGSVYAQQHDHEHMQAPAKSAVAAAAAPDEINQLLAAPSRARK